LSALGPAAVVTIALGWTGGSLSDPDMWWHVRTGRWILDHHAVPHTDPWSFTAPHGHWVPTAWLSDTVFAAVWHLGGYQGIRVLRVALAGLVVVALWLVARRFTSNALAASFGLALALLPIAPFLRERPQVIAYLFLCWLAVLLQQIMAGKRPPVVGTVLLTYLWANVHGSWVLAPAVVLGAGLLSWASDRTRVPLAARCTVVALLSLASTFLTPAGPRLGLWPIVVHRVAAPVTEWQRTAPFSVIGLPFLVLVAAITIRWARTSEPVPGTRVVLVLSLATFGLVAYRYVPPATILLLPEFVRPMQPPDHEAAKSRVPKAALGVLVLGVMVAVVRMAVTPTISPTQPTRVAQELAHRSGQLRVLNSYDVGGLLTGTASPPVRVAIDGRTDIWSASYVRRYVDDLDGNDDWRTLVDQLAPDAAVLPRESTVARGLVAERGWRITLVDGGWALLEPPRAR